MQPCEGQTPQPYAPDPTKTYIYRTYETRCDIVIMGEHPYDYRLFHVETKDGLLAPPNVKVSADWFSLKVGDEWLNFPREYQSTVLDAFAGGAARLVTINGKRLLSADTIPAFMP